MEGPPALQLGSPRECPPSRSRRSTQHHLGCEVGRGAQERIKRASPIRHRMRHAQNTSTARQPRGRIIDGLSIRDRLADVEDPAILDHWEGDLITGSQNTHISHFGGPSVALHPVRENTGERHYQCGTSIEHADMTIDGGIALATIWDRGMNGPAQRIDGRYHGAGLFL